MVKFFVKGVRVDDGESYGGGCWKKVGHDLHSRWQLVRVAYVMGYLTLQSKLLYRVQKQGFIA
jgi:hypothetical protein